MKKNDAVKKHFCELCNYTTNRKYDLKRHQTAKHYTSINKCFKRKKCTPK
jgi:hypothetical protein